jgi:methionyl-tRNA formyltransferase
VTDRRAGGSRVRTVFLGSGSFGRESLRRLADQPGIDLVAVITAPARPAGRRMEIAETPIAGLARELGVTTMLTPARLRAAASIDAILALDPALAVLADYGQILPGSLLGLAHGALNLHPSVLPRHRGASPIPATLLAGDAETGVTLMRMDEGLDTGPIIDQVRWPLGGDETTPELEASLATVAADLLADDLAPWLRGELTPRPQPSVGVTVTRPLRREDGRLDPRRPAAELERQVRAYQPWPGSFVDTPGGRLIVWRSAVGRGVDVAPGTLGVDGLATSAGTLRFEDVQPAGGKRMPWRDFVRGRPGVVGSAVVPGP